MVFSPGATLLRYEDVVRVRLDLSKGRITGATIGAKRGAARIDRIKDPATVVRAIFERAPDQIRWYRSGRPFKKVSRGDVEKLLDTSQARPFDALLPDPVGTSPRVICIPLAVQKQALVSLPSANRTLARRPAA
jgi:hypothetical protein